MPTDLSNLDWAGCSGLFSGGLTPFTLPAFAMYNAER
jgi:hypothetical protein